MYGQVQSTSKPKASVSGQIDGTKTSADEPLDKYFHEAPFSRHYDHRFATKPLKYDDKQDHLRTLIQSFLTTMNAFHVEVFIMHGTLLGWWWNRRILPWDDDLDVMVSEVSLSQLARDYNMSRHEYTPPDLTSPRPYLLDVNPHCWKNEVADGSNAIDARWVDTTTGLYIDVTSLRRSTSVIATDMDGAMMVKDKHQYSYDDIYPLRRSVLESVPVYVPFAYPNLLVREYGEEALTNICFWNHRFDESLAEWVPAAITGPIFPLEE